MQVLAAWQQRAPAAEREALLRSVAARAETGDCAVASCVDLMLLLPLLREKSAPTPRRPQGNRGS